MLIRFRTENFRSIRDEQELSLVASGLSEMPDALVQVERYGIGVLRAAAIYGANASGKSSFFHALGFMRTAVIESHRSWHPAGGIPRVPFLLDRRGTTESSLFVVDILIDGVRYEYGFTINSTRVLEEWLYAWPRGRRQALFTRDASRDVEFAFSRGLPGENRAISSFTRPNSLFLSAAAQNNHEALGPIYRWFAERLWMAGDETRRDFESYTIERCRDPAYREILSSLLQAADLGVTGVDFREPDPSPLLEGWPEGVNSTFLEDLKLPAPLPRVQFRHGSSEPGTEFHLPYDQESRGTRTLFALMGVVSWSLETGSTLVVDELDQSLHTHLARIIVGWFNGAANVNHAQLLFNTHDTNLLADDLLRRDQVWFTEKGADGATNLYPLTDFHARKQENLERGYLQGRYGAVPVAQTSWPGGGVG